MKVYIFLIDFPRTARKKSKLIYIFRLILQKKNTTAKSTNNFKIWCSVSNYKEKGWLCIFSKSVQSHCILYKWDMYTKLQICEFSKLLNWVHSCKNREKINKNVIILAFLYPCFFNECNAVLNFQVCHQYHPVVFSEL